MSSLLSLAILKVKAKGIHWKMIPHFYNPIIKALKQWTNIYEFPSYTVIDISNYCLVIFDINSARILLAYRNII